MHLNFKAKLISALAFLTIASHSFAQTNEEIVAVATIKVKTGQEQKFIKAVSEIVNLTRNEDGCILYNFQQSTSDKTEFLFYERWKSADSLTKHLQANHMVKFMNETSSIVEGTKLQKYTMVDFSNNPSTMNLKKSRCGISAGSNVGEVCFAYTSHPDPYALYFTVYAEGKTYVYKRGERTLSNDQRNATALITDNAGRQSTIEMSWYYEEARYPGDGDDYPLTVSGTTPDGFKFNVRQLSER